ncbi:MAG: hypothetical protein J1F64_01235 [Oscillospiraceae bacterium]|nr:hypothetical protein [Oscillospiraceae bacterium]
MSKKVSTNNEGKTDKINSVIKKITGTGAEECRDILLLLLSMTAVYAVVWSFVGIGNNPYNSYVLQAVAWCKGHLDLGRDYSHLEIAFFNGKYYLSFPPMPSVIYLPFALIWGENLPEELIALITAYLGGIYAKKIAGFFGADGKKSVFWALFVTVGSNLLLLSVNAWVWFIAQSMSFTFAVMSIYYALKNRGALSMTFWACAVGCRPFQIVMFPVIVWILYKNHEPMKPVEVLKRRLDWLLPAVVIGVIYMALNYARFGNVMEFGHKYLPEFVNLDTGMFNGKEYLAQNIKNMFRFPGINSNGTLDYPKFNGMNIFMSSPVFIAGVIYPVMYFIKKIGMKEKPGNIVLCIIVPLMIAAELLCIASKNNMGGFQFGCRYTVDVLPMTFLYIMMTKPDNKNADYCFLPVFVFGLALNVLGTVMLYRNYL